MQGVKPLPKQEVTVDELQHLLIESMYIGAPIFQLNCAEGVLSYVSDLGHAGSNYVGFDLNNKGNYLPQVHAVIELFKSRKIPFCWICEDIREAKLALILGQLGFIKSYVFWGMSYDRCRLLPGSNDQVFAEEVSVDLLQQHAQTIADELDCSVSYVEQTLRSLDYVNEEKLRAYAVFLSSGEVIGFALMIEIPNKSVALLRMAVVLPKYRGIGAYQALFIARMLDAYLSGLESVITYAYEGTAAPILEKFGMQKHQRFTMYQAPEYKQ